SKFASKRETLCMFPPTNQREFLLSQMAKQVQCRQASLLAFIRTMTTGHIAIGMVGKSLSSDRLDGYVFDPQPLSLLLCLLLEQVGLRHVDAGTGVLNKQDAKTRSAQIAGNVEAANVRSDAANDDGSDAAGSQEVCEGRMLRRQRVRLELAIIS